MSHDRLCGLSDRCDDEVAEHGYCSMQHGTFCIHCQQWCICERLAQARADEREQAAQRVVALCAHTKYEGSAPCEHDRAAAAVRGEP